MTQYIPATRRLHDRLNHDRHLEPPDEPARPPSYSGRGDVAYKLSAYLLHRFFFSSRRRHTRFDCDWSSDVCSSDLFARLRHPLRMSLRFGTAELRLGLALLVAVGCSSKARRAAAPGAVAPAPSAAKPADRKSVV